jgi:hypothetical protein
MLEGWIIRSAFVPIPESELTVQFGCYKVTDWYKADVIKRLGSRIAYWQAEALVPRAAEGASSRPDPRASPKVDDTGMRLAQPATEPTTTGRKRGPKPDHETALRLAEIVARVAPDGEWRGKLDDVCEALDEAKIPFPAKWRRDRQWRCWADYLEKPIVIKAIEYRLEMAKQRSKPIPETLS